MTDGHGRRCDGTGRKGLLHLEFGSLETAVLLDEIVDELPRFAVVQLTIRHTGSSEEFLQVTVQVVTVKTLFRIPADVLYVPELRRKSDVVFCEPRLLLILLSLRTFLIRIFASRRRQHIGGRGHRLRNAIRHFLRWTRPPSIGATTIDALPVQLLIGN